MHLIISRVDVDVDCPACGSAVETSSHVFSDSGFARGCWAAVLPVLLSGPLSPVPQLVNMVSSLLHSWRSAHVDVHVQCSMFGNVGAVHGMLYGQNHLLGYLKCHTDAALFSGA
ncbi:hypothetical protein GH714_041942 [Hevea brasiliensis]|uniref:Uncharacterized protein n=1 Tax=Hevea brasiliensis TaxID=3981 RepID=A0A6A6MS14_HEVBR|nr:hypothetical protein GH714_041942 [Hevea brasiliensis]